MASMNKSQRAAHYLDLLRKTKNPIEEAKGILAEIETLVWSNTNQRLTKQEKLEIIEELESLAFPTLRKSERIVEASDNSGILDVISLLKRGVKD
jgi:hypothetical protein